MRSRNRQILFSFICFSVISISLVLPKGVLAAERTWTRSELLAIADEAVQQRGYDVEEMRVAIQLKESSGGTGRGADVLENRITYVSAGGKLVPVPVADSLSAEGPQWVVSYAPLSGDDSGWSLEVTIERDTGEVLSVTEGGGP